MTVAEHIEALVTKHHALEDKIDHESQRPHPDDLILKELKREKLRIKDEIVGLSGDH